MYRLLLITLPDAVQLCLWQLLGEEADKQHNGEASYHGDGTAVNWIDWVAHKHVDHGEADAPNETCPNRCSGDATPVETQEERCQECTSQGTPTDAHELGDERGRIECDEHRNDNEEHDEHTHDDHFAAFNLFCHLVINFASLHFVGTSTLVAINKVEGHGGRRCQHQRCQCGHGSRKHQHHHKTYEEV